MNEVTSNDRLNDTTYDQSKMKEKGCVNHSDCDMEFDKAMSLFESGKVKDCLKTLYLVLYSLKNPSDNVKRHLIGRYISGLESEKKRKKEKNPKKAVERAISFTI